MSFGVAVSFKHCIQKLVVLSSGQLIAFPIYGYAFAGVFIVPGEMQIHVATITAATPPHSLIPPLAIVTRFFGCSFMTPLANIFAERFLLNILRLRIFFPFGQFYFGPL